MESRSWTPRHEDPADKAEKGQMGGSCFEGAQQWGGLKGNEKEDPLLRGRRKNTPRVQPIKQMATQFG